MVEQMQEKFGTIVNVKTWKSRNMREMFGIRDTKKEYLYSFCNDILHLIMAQPVFSYLCSLPV
jgi:hypothetical protein